MNPYNFTEDELVLELIHTDDAFKKGLIVDHLHENYGWDFDTEFGSFQIYKENVTIEV